MRAAGVPRITRYPDSAMRLFRRKGNEAEGLTRAVSERDAKAEEEVDWRSFDSVGATYAELFEAHLGTVAQDLVKLLEVQPGQRVLDVGTGTGVGARAAAAAVGDTGVAVGIDPSVGMLRAATGDGARFAAADTIDLPFRDGRFDRVLANFVIAFFPNYQTALFDVLRVLRPGGRLAVSWWAASDDQDELRRTWRGVAEEFAEHEILVDAQQQVIPWDERFGNRAALKDALHEVGLRDIWTEEREYRFDMPREDWLRGREIAVSGRFLRQMLGEGIWSSFQERVRTVFAERFPPQLNDFRQVNLAVGHKP
jgi:ubiquinone/menaquinone biosynthesis C-methylase UbiE